MSKKDEERIKVSYTNSIVREARRDSERALEEIELLLDYLGLKIEEVPKHKVIVKKEK